MDWYERTERQVGVTGIDDVRRMLSEAGSTATARRRRRTLVALLATTSIVVAAATVVVPRDRGVEVLPPGTYMAAFEAGPVEVVVERDGSISLDAPPALVVDLAFTEDGQMLDSFTVATEGATWEVEVDLEPGGGYQMRMRELPGDGLTRPTRQSEREAPGSTTPVETGPTDGAPGRGRDVEADPDEQTQTGDADGRSGQGNGRRDAPNGPPQEPGPVDDPGRDNGPGDNPGRDNGPDGDPGGDNRPEDTRGRAQGPDRD